MRPALLCVMAFAACETKQETCGPEEYRAPDGSCTEIRHDGDGPDDTGPDDDTGEGDTDGDSGGDTDSGGDSGGGDPVESAASLVGRAWSLDLANARWIEPDGLGSVMGSLTESMPLIGVISATETELEMLSAQSDADDQDGDGDTDEQAPCVATNPLGIATFDNPNLSLGPSSLVLESAGYTISFEELMLTGAWSSDGAELVVDLEAELDTRPIAPLLDPEGGEGAICALVAELEYGECVACSTDGEPFCLSVHVANVVGTEMSVGLTPQDESELPAWCDS